MNRSELVSRARAMGFGKRDHTGERLLLPPNAKQQLRAELIDYYTNDPNGQDAWNSRPIITGEGLADYGTVGSIVDAILREVDEL